MEKLCLILDCTPDYLFQWTPDRKTQDAQNKALSKLNRPSRGFNINDKVNGLSVDKQEIIREFILQMEKREGGVLV